MSGYYFRKTFLLGFIRDPIKKWLMNPKPKLINEAAKEAAKLENSEQFSNLLKHHELLKAGKKASPELFKLSMQELKALGKLPGNKYDRFISYQTRMLWGSSEGLAMPNSLFWEVATAGALIALIDKNIVPAAPSKVKYDRNLDLRPIPLQDPTAMEWEDPMLEDYSKKTHIPIQMGDPRLRKE